MERYLKHFDQIRGPKMVNAPRADENDEKLLTKTHHNLHVHLLALLGLGCVSVAFRAYTENAPRAHKMSVYLIALVGLGCGPVAYLATEISISV